LKILDNECPKHGNPEIPKFVKEWLLEGFVNDLGKGGGRSDRVDSAEVLRGEEGLFNFSK